MHACILTYTEKRKKDEREAVEKKKGGRRKKQKGELVDYVVCLDI